MLSISEVSGCLDQLHFSIELLSCFRSSLMPKQMNRYDYIVFGIENYYLRTTSVFDRCLRLANVVYQLGLPERQCNNDTVIRNEHIKGTSVGNALNDLNGYTGPFRRHRNTIAHESMYSDAALNQYGMYLCAVEEGQIQVVRPHQSLFKNRTDEFVKNKKFEFNKDLAKLENLVEAYFDKLKTVFEAHLERFG